MIDVIQIYKSKGVFTKSTYNPENRKHFQDIDMSFDSRQGYLENDILMLPIHYKKFPEFGTADVTIIQDTKGWVSFLENKHIKDTDISNSFKNVPTKSILSNHESFYTLRQIDSPKAFEFFKLKKSNKDTYEVFLDYESNSKRIGIPKRENYKICDLKHSKPIRYKINGKSDFTLTGSKERTFYEYDFIIEWIGKIDTIEFCELNKISKRKTIPIDNCKLIDERKILR
jgi:hypothetical protein